VLFNGCSINSYSQSHWDNFLKNPNKGSFLALEKAVFENAQRCSWGNSENLKVVPVETGQQLYKLISNGKEYAFYAGLLVSGCLDGGELEDFYRSVGLFLEDQPSVFLKIIRNGTIPKSDIKHMLTMLPEYTVDDFQNKILIIRNRIVLINNVSDESLKEIKQLCISILEKEAETLYRISTTR